MKDGVSPLGHRQKVLLRYNASTFLPPSLSQSAANSGLTAAHCPAPDNSTQASRKAMRHAVKPCASAYQWPASPCANAMRIGRVEPANRLRSGAGRSAERWVTQGVFIM